MSKTKNPSAEPSPKKISSLWQNKKNILLKLFAVLLALLVWQLLSLYVNSDLLLVSPLGVVVRLAELLLEADFLKTLFFSFSRIFSGFFLGLLLGVGLALLSGRFKTAEILLWPYMLTVKSIPVASFAVLAFIWFSGSNLAFLISFLMVLPIVYTNTLSGIRSVDEKMLQMANLFKMPFQRRVRFIWMPALKPFFLSGLKIALGLAWKSGIAAELIGNPNGSVGEKLYYAKVYLETDDLFAWTLVIIILSFAFEKLVLWLVKKLFAGVEKA